jgi:hypothetical protein
MLNDAEERRLLEIEMLLPPRDSDFVRRFDACWTMPARRWFPVLVMIIVIAGLVITAAAVESLIAAVVGLAVLGVLSGFCVGARPLVAGMPGVE